jgi:phosphate transport system protein
MSAAHTVKAFDDDLDQLRAAISEMGGLAEAAISGSMRALVQRDTEAALRIVEEDHKIDALEAQSKPPPSSSSRCARPWRMTFAR